MVSPLVDRIILYSVSKVRSIYDRRISSQSLYADSVSQFYQKAPSDLYALYQC